MKQAGKRLKRYFFERYSTGAVLQMAVERQDNLRLLRDDMGASEE